MLRTLRREDGIALVMALGLMFVLSIVAVAAVTFSGSNTRTASYASVSEDTSHLAEGGLNVARSRLWSLPSANWDTDTTLGTSLTTTIDGTTVQYGGTRSGTTWTLWGHATLPNPTGGSPIVRRSQSQVAVTRTTTTDPRAAAAWEYIYVDSTSCTTLSDNAVVGASMYVQGNLCLDDNAHFEGRRLHVNGYVYVGGLATVGGPLKPIEEAKVKLGCSTGGSHSTCDAAEKVWATTSDAAPPDVIKPSADFASWHANAKPGPMNACTSGSFPGGFDNDSSPNNSRSTVNLMPSFAYDCQFRDGTGALIGRIAWTPGSPGTFTIDGTVAFDGPISVNEGTYAVVSGRGTIYTSGYAALKDNARICGIVGCTSSWSPSTNLLAIIATGWTNISGTNYSFILDDNATFQGAVWSAKGFWASDDTKMYGPVVTDTFHSNDSARTYEVGLGALLPGMPVGSITVNVLANIAGSTTIR